MLCLSLSTVAILTNRQPLEMATKICHFNKYADVRFSLIADISLSPVRFVPVADVKALAEELIDKAVQRKSNEHHPPDNVDVFFQHQWVGFFC